MLKSRKILLFICLTVLVICLCACTPEVNTDDMETKVEEVEDGQSKNLDEEIAERPDVVEAYLEAAEAYSWFDLATMDYDTADTVEYASYQYARVTHETIQCLEDLENYLRTLFSDKIVSELLKERDGIQQYRDFNGQLYVIPAGRGADITKGKAQGEIVYESPTQVQFHVTVEVLNPENSAVIGEETYEFLYEYTAPYGDARWAFTKFESIR